jgi:ferredoxin
MGLSWQQGPLSPGAIGRFLVPEPLPTRLLCAEPLRRRMRVRFGGSWIADSDHVVLLFEPGRYPVAYFPEKDVSPQTVYQSILELAEACDVPVRWSCRTGVCHNCESGLVSGAVVYRPEPLEKAADGNLLLCCSQPIQDVVVDL